MAAYVTRTLARCRRRWKFPSPEKGGTTMPKVPQNVAALALLGAVAVAGAITGLAADHIAIPQILTWTEATLLAGAFGLAIPGPPAPPA